MIVFEIEFELPNSVWMMIMVNKKYESREYLIANVAKEGRTFKRFQFVIRTNLYVVNTLQLIWTLSNSKETKSLPMIYRFIAMVKKYLQMERYLKVKKYFYLKIQNIRKYFYIKNDEVSTKNRFQCSFQQKGRDLAYKTEIVE